MCTICNWCWLIIVSVNVYIWLSWWNQGLRDSAYFVYVLTSFIQASLTTARLEKLQYLLSAINSFFQSTHLSIHVACGMFGCQSLSPKAPSTTFSTTPSLLGSWPFVFDPPVSLLHLTGFAADSPRHERSLNWQASSSGPYYLVQWSWIVS